MEKVNITVSKRMPRFLLKSIISGYFCVVCSDSKAQGLFIEINWVKILRKSIRVGGDHIYVHNVRQYVLELRYGLY